MDNLKSRKFKKAIRNRFAGALYSIAAALAAAGLFGFAGCMTPERAVTEADEAGNRIASEYIAQVTGKTNDFTIARPSDRLRNRLLLEQNLNPAIAEQLRASLSNRLDTASLPDPLVINLDEAMRIAIENSEDYQAQKESLFSTALALDLSRHEFENTFAGAFGLDGSSSKSTGSEKSEKVSGSHSTSFSRKLESGATLAASVGLDIVRLLTGGDSTMGLSASTSYSIPLLRGSGRKIAMESLTQAERSLMYAVHDFETFRCTFAISIADAYYSMLQVDQRLQALRENSERLTENYRRAQMLYDSGRLSQVDLDQTRQEILNTGDSLVTAEKSRQAQLDSFKMTLGLPVDARIELDMTELNRLRTYMGLDSVNPTNTAALPREPKLKWTEDEAIEIALTNRTELILARFRLEDAERQLDITRDNLRWGADLKIGINYGKNKSEGSSATDSKGISASLSSDIPWDKRSERNAYRTGLISYEKQVRSFEILQDKTRQLIRSDIRSLNSAWSSYIIQSEALVVAQRRVRSTTLFQQAGKSSTRDLLEAESSLLNARNSVISAIIDYRKAKLQLLQDMSLLNVSEEGQLIED